MPRFYPIISAIMAGLSIVALSACSTPKAVSVDTTTATATPVVAPHPPPPRRAEIPPPAPSPHALWSFGHWRWNGAKYVWAPGRYVERPTPTANWIPGYWEQQPGGWRWVEDQWTS